MPIPAPDAEDRSQPFPGFAFHVQFARHVDTSAGAGGSGGGAFEAFTSVPEEVAGGFQEIAGLEASMEPKAIKVGGRNYGPVQRAGPVTFATVTLKRGIIASRHLWNWWSWFAGADHKPNGGWSPASRCDVSIALIRERTLVVGWQLEKAMPVKFRIGDLNARGTDVAIEELHLVHEGLHAWDLR
jgi:phage tail-like protein